MLAEDALVIGSVVAEDRLAPVMRSQLASPEGIAGTIDGGWVSSQDLRDVERPLTAVVEPEEIEDADKFVWPGRSDLWGQREGPTEPVGSYPSVALQIPRLGCRRQLDQGQPNRCTKRLRLKLA